MKIFGLTGGIERQPARDMLQREGVPVIDADAMGHRLLEGDPVIQKDVTDAFGPEIIENGALSRERLAALVFSNVRALARLNAILHPAIIRSIQEECRGLARQGHEVVVVEAALVGEEGRLEPWLSGLILVLAETETRVQRLITLRKMREDDARRRIAAQMDPALKMPVADYIVYNDGDVDALEAQASALAARLRDSGSGHDKVAVSRSR